MLELGATEAAAHELVLDLCCCDSIGLIMLVGERFLAAAEKLKLLEKIDVVCSSDVESLAAKVREFLGFDDAVKHAERPSLLPTIRGGAVVAGPLSPTMQTATEVPVSPLVVALPEILVIMAAMACPIALAIYLCLFRLILPRGE
ncbi:hypothetical protein MA16_Dca026435 [Dendrobium catenatum]|uniref:Uncharacterized protein n=1 Tax=Dendrobium catenatum TaxID=906689 RepID=A0A2I0XFW8_9ASPA|nr:hypothetical protein MA16_Dca026435 [Dendrobium catenatum]